MFDFIVDEGTPPGAIVIGSVLIGLAFYGLYDIIIKVIAKVKTKQPS